MWLKIRGANQLDILAAIGHFCAMVVEISASAQDTFTVTVARFLGLGTQWLIPPITVFEEDIGRDGTRNAV